MINLIKKGGGGIKFAYITNNTCSFAERTKV